MKNKMNKEDWDDFWDNHDFPFITKLGFAMEFDSLKDLTSNIRRIKDKVSILDYGCGEGRTLSYFRDLGFKNIAGLDISDVACAKCTRKGFKLDNNGSNKTYDIVFSQGMIEHYKRSKWDKIIKDMTKRSNQLIILMQPLTKNYTFKACEFIIKHTSDFLDVVKEYDYDIRDYANAFSEHGFLLIYAKTTHGLPQFLDTSIFLVFRRVKT